MRKSRCQGWRRREGGRPETLHGRPALPRPQAVKPSRSSHQSRVIDEGHHCAERSPQRENIMWLPLTPAAHQPPAQQPHLRLRTPWNGPTAGVAPPKASTSPALHRQGRGRPRPAEPYRRLHRRGHPHRASPKTHISPRHLQALPMNAGQPG